MKLKWLYIVNVCILDSLVTHSWEKSAQSPVSSDQILLWFWWARIDYCFLVNREIFINSTRKKCSWDSTEVPAGRLMRLKLEPTFRWRGRGSYFLLKLLSRSNVHKYEHTWSLPRVTVREPCETKREIAMVWCFGVNLISFLVAPCCSAMSSGCLSPPPPKHDFWAAQAILNNFCFWKKKIFFFSKFFFIQKFFLPPKKFSYF